MLMFVHDALNNFLLLFAGSLLLMLSWLAKHWAEQIGVNVKNERAKGILQRAELLAMAVVKRVFQAYVRPAQASGRWDDAAQAEAKRQAVAELRSALGRQGILDLAWVLYGEGNAPPGVEVGVIGTLIEAAVHDAKHQGRVIAAAYAPGPQPPPSQPPLSLFGPKSVDRQRVDVADLNQLRRAPPVPMEDDTVPPLGQAPAVQPA